MNRDMWTAAGSSRWFAATIATLVLLLVFIGFAPTYYLTEVFDGPVLARGVQVHGLIFSTWVVVFLAQTTLVARRQIAWHRRLGAAGAVLAAAMIVSGLHTAIASAQRGHTPIPALSPLAFLAIPLFDILVFALLAGAGLYLRRRPDAHRRFMLLATIALLAPAIARLPVDFIRNYGPLAFFPLADLFLVACFVYDWHTRRRIHWATVAGTAIIVVSQPLRLALARSDTWLAFAGWLTGSS